MAELSPRRKLSLRHSGSTEDRIARTHALILQALQQGLCLRWSYNRTTMRVAPQILHASKGELYVDAIAVEKNGETPDELKLGRFKLSGLSGLAMTSEPLAPIEAIDFSNIRYAEAILARAEA